MSVEAILDKMSLKDKIALCSGASFWETKEMKKYGIPSMFMCDGPHGLRKQVNAKDMLGLNQSLPATCFPTAVSTGASWDEALMERIGRAIGAEAAQKQVGLVLGPGANLKRNPLCGRNFEYFSEDPYLTGKMAAGFIRGLQENGTSASLKHYACNSQEENRFTSDGILDERTMRELYLTGFEIAVKEARPDTVMCAYPKVNGVHCSDSKELLQDILREEWGFEGLVVTDWSAMNDRIEGFLAGCDLNMPGGSAYMEKEVLQAVKSGRLSEEAVDACARRVLELVCKERRGMEEASRLSERGERVALFDKEAHHALAREAAEQGAVLLKNEDHILPLQQSKQAALIGHMAKHPRYQGGGSSHINPYQTLSAAEVMYRCTYAPGCDGQGDTNEELLAEAVQAAGQADVAVVFVGLPEKYECEGFDRENLQLPKGHLRLLDAVCEANSNVVVVLTCGSVVECPWADKVKAILYVGLPGQAGGHAIANLLYGKANPSGRLTESWPYAYEDCITKNFYGQKDAQYRESVYVGYRYYDKADIAVRWPFGYGLSYTEFAYSELQIAGDTVTVTVTNVGERDGAEVVQLYVEAPVGGLHRPVRELKGFQKVFLTPGESKEVKFTLEERSFALWDGGWKVPAGEYGILVGGSDKEQLLCGVIYKEGEPVVIPSWQPGSWYEQLQGEPTQEEWEAMLGRRYEEKKPVKGQFTMDNSVIEMMESCGMMRLIYKVTEKIVAGGIDGPKDDSNPEYRMMMAASVGGPLRSMQIASGMKGGLFKGLLQIANGHIFKGILTMLGLG